MRKILIYLLVLLDVVAILVSSSFAVCLGPSKQECQSSLTSPITWAILLLASALTGFYIYKRRKQGLPSLPFKLSLLDKLNVPWSYFPYYFFALIFWGENMPEIAGYLKGLPLGAPGTHASLMNPALFFQGNSGTTINLITFAMMSFAITVFYKKLNFVLAWIGTAILGTIIEYVTKLGKPQGGPEGFDIYNNFLGTILNFMWLWTLLALVPYFIFRVVEGAWKTKGVVVLTVLMVLLNIASYFFSYYEMYVLKNIQPGFLSNVDVLPVNTCPDQLVIEDGKPFAYKGGKGMFIKDQADVDWIKNNCPDIK
ncbi:hypothetical protein HYW43_03170 [Candidatus Daviesbacteria bacterium]|nr:hypothetical protein [Candidatus Daviesbacteria bacterium]